MYFKQGHENYVELVKQRSTYKVNFLDISSMFCSLVKAIFDLDQHAGSTISQEKVSS